MFDADVALEARLVSLVVAPYARDAATETLLDSIRQTEPNAVAVTRRLLTELPGMDVPTGLRHAEAISIALFDTPEAAEGMAAFREKRPPAWADGS
jgi:methylglutaconyl-CoA hydratase